MSVPGTALTYRKPSNLPPILWGGLVVGILDILSAIIGYGLQFGSPPIRILQSVASGWMGRAAYQGGVRTAVLGLATHFFIATCVAAVYWFASRKFPVLVSRAVLFGLLYGLLVYVVMQYVVIPMSAIHTRAPMSWAKLISGPLGYPFVVGLPAALISRRFSRPQF